MSKGFGKQGSKSEINISASYTTPSTKKAMDNTSESKSAINIIKSSKESIDTTLSNHFPSLNLEAFPNLHALHYDPPVLEIPDFLSTSVCDKYILEAQSLGYQIPSQTFGGNSNSNNKIGSIRTSTTWYMKYSDVKEFVNQTQYLLNWPSINFEEPQIVRYEFGQQFSWHYDAIPKTMLDSSGQRLATVIVYLNDILSSGGATVFKDLGISVIPKKGKALIFFPCYRDGRPDDRTMHAGQVTMDTKWIAQMWIHEHAYSPNLPPGNIHVDCS